MFHRDVTSLHNLFLEKCTRLAAAVIVLVVRSDLIRCNLTRAVRVEVVRHVVALRLHVGAHLIERRGRDDMALAVDLPCDRRIRGAHGVVSGRTGRGTSVISDFTTLITVNNHTSKEVRVIVVLVVDDGENLRLHTDSLMKRIRG